MDSKPIGIFFATSCTNGDKLVFRYPNAQPKEDLSVEEHKSLKPTSHYLLESSLIPKYSPIKPHELSHIDNNIVVGFSDDELASMLVSAKVQLIKRKFELKISDVLFVGYMNRVVRKGDHMDVTFNVIFALQPYTDPNLISRYQEVCEMIGLALIHEEGRKSYLSNQKQKILDLHEGSGQSGDKGMTSAEIHDKVSNSISLGEFFKALYDEVVRNGSFDLYLNKWIRVSYSICPKVWTFIKNHPNHYSKVKLPMFDKLNLLDNYLDALKPYHTFIMLENPSSLLERFPADRSPVLRRLLKCHTATKNLVLLAAELDVALSQVRRLVCALICWGCAMIVYPVFDANVYLVSPRADLSPNSALAERFSNKFQKLCMLDFLSEFSLPFDLNYHRNNSFKCYKFPKDDLSIYVQNNLVPIVVWLLKHKMIYQLHKYVYNTNNTAFLNNTLSPPSNDDDEDDDDVNFDNDKYHKNKEVDDKEKDVSQFEEYNKNTTLQTGFVKSTPKRPNKLVDFSNLPKPLISSSNTTIDVASPGSLFWKSTDVSSSTSHSPLVPQAPPSNLFPHSITTETSPKADQNLFERLSSKYFNGEYHLEHVMFKERMIRGELSSIIDRYSDHLIIYQHEEVYVSYWVSKDV